MSTGINSSCWLPAGMCSDTSDDLPQNGLDVCSGRCEGIGVDDQWGSQHHEWCPMQRHSNRLFHTQAADRLHWNIDGCDDGGQFVQRAWHAIAQCSLYFRIAPFIIADMMNDIVDAEIPHHPARGRLVLGPQVVAHHLDPKVAPGAYDFFDR